MRRALSSALRSSERAGLPSLRWGWSFSSRVVRRRASLSPARAFLISRAWTRSMVARSARASSVTMVSMSAMGSTRPLTWTTLGSSKQRTTLTTASVSRMLARNWLPRPSPLLAPATRPAMSTNSTMAGWIFWGWTISASLARRGSGTSTMPTLGSMVQKG